MGMTFYLKHPGQEDGDPIGEPGEYEMSWDHGVDLGDWALYLPHQCDAWNIADGDRETTLAEAREFRAELDAAIKLLEAS
jgi:hypothetical protein